MVVVGFGIAKRPPPLLLSSGLLLLPVVGPRIRWINTRETVHSDTQTDLCQAVPTKKFRGPCNKHNTQYTQHVSRSPFIYTYAQCNF